MSGCRAPTSRSLEKNKNAEISGQPKVTGGAVVVQEGAALVAGERLMKNLIDTNMSDSEAKQQHREGGVAKAIEQQTAKIPSDVFLWTAMGAIGASLFMELSGRKQTGNFIATWVPTLLILGVYNKIVKTEGSDRTEDWAR